MAKNLVNFYKGGGKVKPTHSDAPAYIIGQDENGFPIYRNPESAKGASFNRSFPAIDFMKQRPNSYKEVSNPFNYGTLTPTIGGGYGGNFGGKLNPIFNINTGYYVKEKDSNVGIKGSIGLAPDIRVGDSFIPHTYIPEKVFTPSVEVGNILNTSVTQGNEKLKQERFLDLKGKFTRNINQKTSLYGYGELLNNEPIIGIGGNFSYSNLKDETFNFGIGYNFNTNSPTVTGRMVLPINYKSKYNKPIDFKTEPSFKYGGKITKKYKSSIKPYGPPTNPQGMSQGPTMQRGVMFANGGLIFLQPNNPKLKKGYNIPSKYPSTELATSIGGENGESAYLIPSFKEGHNLNNPLQEFNRSHEYLGGPFKTWQEADKWEREVRHPYVEKGQSLPSPLRWWGKEYKKGGPVNPQGGLSKAQVGTIIPKGGFKIQPLQKPEIYLQPTNRESTATKVSPAKNYTREKAQYLNDPSAGYLGSILLGLTPADTFVDAGAVGYNLGQGDYEHAAVNGLGMLIPGVSGQLFQQAYDDLKYMGNTRQPYINPSEYKRGGKINPLDDPKNKPTIYRTSGDVRSEYDPVSNNIYWNPYNNPQAPLNVLKHEGYHWAQNMFGDLQIPELYPGPLRRPQTPVNPNTSQIGDYYNRSAVEQNYIGNKFVNENPSFQFTPSDLVFNRVVDPSQYDYNVYPNTTESDAQRYEDYAPTNLNKPIMGKYGPTDVNKYANGGTVNWLDQYEAGDIKNPSNQSDFNYPHIRKFKDGGSTNPPIYVTDPNDPRLRAYEDSLALSNFSKLQHKLEPPLSNWLNPFAKNVDERNKGQFILEKTAQDLVNNNSNISWESSRYAGTGAKFIVDSRRNPNIKKGYVMDQYWPEIWKDEIIPEYVDNQSPDIIHKTIKPIGHWWGRGQNNEYIAPVQPYIYSKPDTDLNQGNINISRNNYPGAVASRTDEDYTKQHSPIYVTDRNNPNIGQYNEAGNQYVYTPPPPMKKMKSIEPSFNTTQEQPQTRPYVESSKPNFYMDSRGEWSDKPQTAPIYTEEQLLKMGYRNPQRKKEGGGVYTPMNEQIFPLLKFANGGKTSAITQKSDPSFRPLFLPQSLPTGYTDWNDWYAQNPNPKTLPVVTQKAPKGLDYANLYHRQAAKESGMFTPSIVSGKQKSSRGAMGMTQIMPSAKQEYEKATHKSLNLSDPKQAVQAQEWMMGNLLKRPWVSSPKNQSDSVAAAKALVAYNWGPQRTIDYLNAAKAKGIDIYSNKLEWLKGLPLESRDYVSKILLAKDAGFEQDYNEVKNKFRNLYTTPKKKQGGQVTSWLDTLK